jgi:hypothetical protein
MAKKRADERTRTADLPSLRVGGQWLLSVAEARVLLSALL